MVRIKKRATNHLIDRQSNASVYGGLTDFGRKVIHEMNRIGMIVDLSHASLSTMLDALEETKAPLIFSHSSIYTICNNSRNVQDDVLLKLVNRVFFEENLPFEFNFNLSRKKTTA